MGSCPRSSVSNVANGLAYGKSVILLMRVCETNANMHDLHRLLADHECPQHAVRSRATISLQKPSARPSITARSISAYGTVATAMSWEARAWASVSPTLPYSG